MEAFLDAVPRAYLAYIENLDVCTAPHEPTRHANARPGAVRLHHRLAVCYPAPLCADTLRVSGTLDNSVIAPFPYLQNLRKLSMANVGDEVRAPFVRSLFLISGQSSNEFVFAEASA